MHVNQTWLLRARKIPRAPPHHPITGGVKYKGRLNQMYAYTELLEFWTEEIREDGPQEGTKTYVCCISLTDQPPPWCSVKVLTDHIYHQGDDLTRI